MWHLLITLLAQMAAPSLGATTEVMMAAKLKKDCGQAFSKHFWIPARDLQALGMPSATCKGGGCGSVVLNGASYDVDKILGHDGSDACGLCHGCTLAFVKITTPINPPGTIRCGETVQMTYTAAPSPGPPPPGPSPTAGISFETGGLYLELSPGSLAAQSLNKSVPEGSKRNKTNDFSFVGFGHGHGGTQRVGCHNLGDITLRAAPAEGFPTAKGSLETPWATFASAFGGKASWRLIKNVSMPHDSDVLIAHDITAVLNASQAYPGYSNSLFPGGVPVRVVRSWEKVAGGLVLRFKITNTFAGALKVGGLGFPMPQAGMQKGIEQSVWLDPHIGADHGFVEWVRVVVDEQVLLATADGPGSPMEGWRPLMEGCSQDDWEWTVHSEAWAAEWKENKQWPFLEMEPSLAAARSKIDNTMIWPEPRASPWPAWKKGETVPITDFEGIAAPWNIPTSATFKAGETKEYAIRLTLAEAGPRTRNAALLAAGRSVLQAVPGYVVSPDMTSAKLFVTPPTGITVKSVTVDKPSILAATIVANDRSSTAAATKPVEIDIAGKATGRARVSITFSDASVNTVHYAVLPPLKDKVAAVGTHWAEDAWLPLEYPDPFGRAAAVMPYDRHDRQHVLDDSRGYDVGISDDAGGGNPLGFAIKVAYAPDQFQVTRLDDYVKWTLFGVKSPDKCPQCGAKFPYKSLQIRPEDCIPADGDENGSQCGNEDGIRMTMYYYGSEFNNSFGGFSGHWNYNYSGAWGIGAPGMEGGPNWPMSESMANNTYRSFNFPHHVTTYLSLYYAARHTTLSTYKPWDWYLMRAANTTIKFGRPTTGVMDDTTFREILNAVVEEAEADPARTDFRAAAVEIRRNMHNRAVGFASVPYPYGSEFAFDTTGQEAVVVWLLYFATATNGFAVDAKRTVDHILSYMRSSGTWAYNGGSRSWGDVGNNGKWQATAGARYETRGNFHYRSGLNAIPLLEWYRQNPDDLFLLEPALGAVAGQMTNIDEFGAPGMMMHMEPHVLDYDPHSGDYGLGFFGCSVESGAYLVDHPDLGLVCYLCNMMTGTDGNVTMAPATDGVSALAAGVVTIKPVDLYRRRVFLEPLSLYLTLDAGTFESVAVDVAAKKLTVTFNPMAADNCTYTARRLRLDKTSAARPGAGFKLAAAGIPLVRNAYVIPEATTSVVVTWD